MTIQHPRVSDFQRNLLVAAAASAAVLITMGGVVCATQASGGCPDWPRCHGALLPPLQMDSMIEYSHRLVALLTSLLVIASAVVGWNRNSGRALRVLPTVAVILIGVVAVFGAFAVLTGLPPILAAIDLGTALIVLTLVIAAAVIASMPDSTSSVARPHGLAWSSVTAAVAMFTLIDSGVFVARGSVMRCIGGPLHIGNSAAMADPVWLYAPRQILAAATVLLAAAVVITAMRSAHVDATTRRWSIAFAAFFATEMILGAALVVVGPDAVLLIASAAATVAMWSALVIVAVRAHLVGPSVRAEVMSTATTATASHIPAH